MKDKKERKVSLYKVVMLVILTIFLTFMVTSLLIYGYFINGKQLGKYVLVTKSENESSIADELSKYRTIIDKYFLSISSNAASIKSAPLEIFVISLDFPLYSSGRIKLIPSLELLIGSMSKLKYFPIDCNSIIL